MKKRHLIISILIFVLVASTATLLTFAYFYMKEEILFDREVGMANIEIKPYFLDDNSKKIYLDLVLNTGVIDINISDYSNDLHFNRFGVDVEVKSNIDTYFRIAVYEQFALTYISGGKETVVAITRDEFAPFNYSNSFHDSRLNDQYYYFKTKTNTSNEINVFQFITPLGFSEDVLYPLYENRYKIMLGITAEIVQAHLGPEKNWGLTSPPWDTNTSW